MPHREFFGKYLLRAQPCWLPPVWVNVEREYKLQTDRRASDLGAGFDTELPLQRDRSGGNEHCGVRLSALNLSVIGSRL